MKANSAIILKTMIRYSASEVKPIWYICDTGSSGMNAACRALRRKKRRAAYYIGARDGETSLVFSRTGELCEDPAVRPLGEEDSALILSILGVSEDDSDEAKGIAGVIHEELTGFMAHPGKHLLGLFDDEALVGVLVFHNRGEVVVISDVFVPREHRRHGYAARLVRAATAMHPGTRYVYSCGSQNTASIATAHKAGYALAGACVFGA